MYRLLLTILFAVTYIQAHQIPSEAGPKYTMIKSTATENTINEDPSINLIPHDKTNVYHSFLSKVSDHIAEHINKSFRGSLDHITDACQNVLSTTTNQTVMSQHVQEGLTKIIDKAGSKVIKNGLESAINKFMSKF